MIKAIQVETNNQLKTAKALKKIADKLFNSDLAITFDKGDFKLKQNHEVRGLISYHQEIVITANSEENLLAVGTQALLRLFTKELAQGDTSVVYEQAQRILMIDVGRKYFSKEILFKFIDSMSLAQFNYLQLHFSENEGFRIESEIAPELMSEHYLTKNEIREIILYAELSGIEIIPDFDTPGHLRQILKNKPEWQLMKKTKEGELERQPSALNIVNSEAVLFIESLYEEYAELFNRSKYFHIGGDEFVDFDEIDAYPDLKEAAVIMFGEEATAMDYFTFYVNQLSEKVSSLGFIPRVWNDGFFRLNRKELVTLSEKVEVTYWTKWNKNMASVETFKEKDYTIINFNDNYFYYVLGEAAGYSYPTYEKIMQEWVPTMYPQSQSIAELTKQFPGVAVAIWSDIPSAQDEFTIWKNVTPLLLAVNQKLTSTFISSKHMNSILNQLIE